MPAQSRRRSVMISPAPKPEILRSEEYRQLITGLPCVCGCKRPGHAHHAQHRRGFGDARNLVPLYWECHLEGHTIGWKTWQKRKGVKLQPVADILWEMWLKLRGEDGCIE